TRVRCTASSPVSKPSAWRCCPRSQSADHNELTRRLTAAVARTGPPPPLPAGGARCRWYGWLRAQDGRAEELDLRRRAAGTALLSLTRFFGREQATAELIDVVERARLVTLVGAPGCGKTRLGLEVSARLAERLPARVIIVELRQIRAPSHLPSAVAAGIDGGAAPARPTEDVLVEALGIDDVLIVLDGCEHLGDAVGDLVVRLL